jgi:hypothetical protein
MEWSARSPDLNPIEHLWDNMGKQLRTMEYRPNHLNFKSAKRSTSGYLEKYGPN